MGSLFGTDGVRGIANVELTGELAFALGRASALVICRNSAQPRILIGMDTRISGDMLESALIAGILSAGANAVSVGVLPTPGIAYLVRQLQYDAGVVISASHNPVVYNGIKFFDSNGEKLPDALEDEIEALLVNEGQKRNPNVGRHLRIDGAESMYMDFLFSQVERPLIGMTVVLDCANGASSHIAPALFNRLGVTVHEMHCEPNGLNINEHCGSTHPKSLQKAVVELGADIGLAFDGDADRLIACDEKGELVDGDVIIGLLALSMKEEGKLKKDCVVVTQMSNMGLELSLRPHSIHLVKTAVGDRYVHEAMQEGDYNLGGEQSGHVLLPDRSTTGDGMQTAIAFLGVLQKARMPLSELRKNIRILPQVLTGAKVKADCKQKYVEIADAVNALQEAYADCGRVLIRPSGTEHLIRIMIEGPDLEKMEQEADELRRLMEQFIGA